MPLLPALCALVALLALLPGGHAADGIRDHPIAGSSLQYLDGDDWTASAQVVSWAVGACTFEANVDYNEGTQGPNQKAGSPSDCCSICSQQPDCFAGVFYQGTCWLKSWADSYHKTPSNQSGVTACVPQRTATPLQNVSIAASVPGDLVSDLYNANLIPDPLWENTWRTYAHWWDGQTWTYTKTFAADNLVQAQRATRNGESSSSSRGSPAGDYTLVFEGVKMAANVTLNGVFLGTLLNQFVRFTFDVSNILQAENNQLEVVFDYRYDVAANGRFMACTGGWDWAPVSTTKDLWGHPTFTRGIWKSVYVVSTSSVTITQVVPQIFYAGPYPVAPLSDDAHSPFNVTVQVFLQSWSSAPQNGELRVVGEWDSTTTYRLPITVGYGRSQRDVSFVVPGNVSLWWPAGMGAQKLYNLTVNYAPDAPGPFVAVSTTRRVGFRVLAMVTGNDTDPSFVAHAGEGTTNYTLMFRVNGAAMWVRGANMIPMEELEARADGAALRRLVASAAEGNMNMLRIWGGGIFQYDEFYDACDDYGILLFHDMQYAQQDHDPDPTDPLQAIELTQQVQRLSHHPSIAVWDGCNECGGLGVYASFVMTTVAIADRSRAIWPSCPADGWSTGVDALYARPNGNPLGAKNRGGPAESHGPYMTGNGWCTDEEAFWKPCDLRLFTPELLPDVSRQPVGVGVARGNFRSEFGCSVWTSFESISPLLDPLHWGLHAPPMFERNWPVDNIVQSYFGMQNLNLTGEAAFKRQLYQSMLSQALYIKQQVEGLRGTNNFGTLIWQFNEIWPTGGWGSIEYGSRRPGQVVGGRWKLLHYWLRSTIFPDLAAACSWSGMCFVRNDGGLAVDGFVVINVIRLRSSQEISIAVPTFSLGPGPAAVSYFCITADCQKLPAILAANGCDPTGADCLLSLGVRNSFGDLLSSNLAPLQPFANMSAAIPTSQVQVSIADTLNLDGSVDITLTATPSAALYVVLTTQAPGRFSDNGVTVLPSRPVVLQFIPWEPLDTGLLRSSLRVEHLQPNL